MFDTVMSISRLGSRAVWGKDARNRGNDSNYKFLFLFFEKHTTVKEFLVFLFSCSIRQRLPLANVRI